MQNNALLTCALVLSICTPVQAIQPRDLGTQDLALVNEALTKYQIIDLYPDKTLRGSRPITRAEMAQMAWKLVQFMQSKLKINISISTHRERYISLYLNSGGGDILERHWAVIPIQKVLALGLMRGNGKQFEPQRLVTRYELAALLLQFERWLNLLKRSEHDKDLERYLPFDQLKDMPPQHWAQMAVKAQIEKGTMYPDQWGHFRGNQPATRYDLLLSLVHLGHIIQRVHAQGELLIEETAGIQKRLDGREIHQDRSVSPQSDL